MSPEESNSEDRALQLLAGEERYLDELRGKNQGLISLCRDSIGQGADTTRALLAVDSREERAFRHSRRHFRSPPHASEEDVLSSQTSSVDLSAAQAICAMANGVVGNDPPSAACSSLLRHGLAVGLISVGEQLVGSGASCLADSSAPVRNTVAYLVGQGAEPARGFAILMALELAGCRPKTLRSAEIPVLFQSYDPGTNGRLGEVGVLTLALLEDGPSGIHPDPARMSFLEAGDAVVHGVRAAWEVSRLRDTSACVLWSVTVDDGHPTETIDGGSLAAAFAVALDDLAPRALGRRRLRLRTLAKDWAVTASLDGDNLRPVAGYAEKLAAARDKKLRVIVAEAAVERARRSAPPGFDASSVIGARRVSDAIRLTRTRLDPAAVVAAVLTAVLVVAVPTGVVVWRKADDARDRISLSATLAGRSEQLSNSDSRMSALLALAADDMFSSAQSRSAMLNAVQNNQAIVDSADTRDGPVRRIATDGNVVLTAGDSSKLKVWTSSDLEPIGSLDLDDTPLGLAANPYVKALVALTRNSISIYQSASGRLPEPVTTVSTPHAFRSGDNVHIFGPIVDNESGSIVAIDDRGNGVFFAPGVAESGVAFKAETSDRIVAVGDLVTENQGRDSGLKSLLIATATQDVMKVEFTTNPRSRLQFPPLVSTVVPASQVRGPVVSLVREPAVGGGRIYIGTEGGVQLWDPQFGSTIAYPLGGVAERPAGIDTSAGIGLIVVTPTGVKLITNTGTVALNNTSGQVSHGTITAASLVEQAKVVVGRSDGRLVLLDLANKLVGLQDGLPAAIARFASGNQLATASFSAPQRISRVDTQNLPSDGIRTDDEKVFRLPGTEFDDDAGNFVNGIATNDSFVAAGGISNVDRKGRVWVWDRRTGQLIRTITFSPDSRSDSLDIVTGVVFAPLSGLLAALNPWRGEVGIWSTEDWQLVRRVPIGTHATYDDIAQSGVTANSDGSVVLVQSHPSTGAAQQILIDLTTGAVSELPVAATTSLSPDGRQFSAAVGNVLSIYDVDGRKRSEVDLKSPVGEVAWSPRGTQLAVGLPLARQIAFLNADTMVADRPPLNVATGMAPNTLDWGGPHEELLAVTTVYTSNNNARPGPVQIFDTTDDSWRDALCGIAGSDLTDAEWTEQAGKRFLRPVLCP